MPQGLCTPGQVPELVMPDGYKRSVAAWAVRLNEQPFPDGAEADVARLSPFVRHHVNMLGRYSFRLPDLPGGLRPLREPGADELRQPGGAAFPRRITLPSGW